MKTGGREHEDKEEEEKRKMKMNLWSREEKSGEGREE